MPDRDPRRELATLETCPPCDRCGVEGCPLAFTGDGYVCEGCWPDAGDNALPDPISQLELRVHELRCLVAGYDEARLATLPAPERRLIEETALHLAEYDRAKRGEGGHG
jgi:hypothetical protein